jgi:hypothetical protein
MGHLFIRDVSSECGFLIISNGPTPSYVYFKIVARPISTKSFPLALRIYGRTGLKGTLTI